MDIDFDEDVDYEKIDEMTLAIIFLTTFQFEDDGVARTWKGYDFETMERLAEKGFIENPKGKSRSVGLPEKGIEYSQKLFMKHFLRQ